MDEPSIIKSKRMTCCHRFKVERLMVLRPASVMAETARNSASTKRTLRGGVDEPQKMIAAIRQVTIK
jgi:hypothetical protein